MNHKKISDAAIRRLPRYYRHLKEMEREGILRTSSQALSQRMRTDLHIVVSSFPHRGGSPSPKLAACFLLHFHYSEDL